jgi:EPS-associated MarR family transcriptional regulator
MPVLTDPQRLQLLKLLQDQPQMSQRDLAQAMGVSLGKANYCLKALMEKGLVKFGNFRRNPDKRQYAYLLTAAGLEEKTRITMAFLRRKVEEYETLEREIEQLRGDLKGSRIQPDARTEGQAEHQ